MTIKSVGVFSVGKIFAILQGAVGLIIGCVIALASMAGAFMVPAAGPDFNGGGPMALLFGGGAIILFPLIYAVMGFIAGVIGALIYNVVASVVGGIELVLE